MCCKCKSSNTYVTNDFVWALVIYWKFKYAIDKDRDKRTVATFDEYVSRQILQ